MKAATFAMSLVETGDGQSLTWTPPVPVGSSASPAETISVSLIAGTVEVALPAGCVGFAYVPTVTVGVVVQKTLKFASSDVGAPMAVALPTPYDWEGAASPPSNIWLTATGVEQGLLYLF